MRKKQTDLNYSPKEGQSTNNSCFFLTHPFANIENHSPCQSVLPVESQCQVQTHSDHSGQLQLLNLLSNTRFSYFWAGESRSPAKDGRYIPADLYQTILAAQYTPRQQVTNPGLAYTSQSPGFNVVRAFSYLERPCRLIRSCPRQQPSLLARIYYVGLV